MGEEGKKKKGGGGRYIAFRRGGLYPAIDGQSLVRIRR